MTDTSQLVDPKQERIYTFHFRHSNKHVELTDEELDHFPYLIALVAHKNDFLSVENENGEYVLSHSIQYPWFISILRSIRSEQPYTLFNELSEDNNVLDTLQLFDYLCINPFPLPLLKYEELVRSNPTNTDNDEKRLEYHQANLSEARQTAAEFIIALSKNEYDLRNSYTIKRIFSLIRVILSNPAVFSSRFRHHTLIVMKDSCYSFFSKTQRRLLPTIQQIDQHRKIDALIYLYDDDKPLPDHFQNTFAWRSVYLPIEENPMESLYESPAKTSFSSGSSQRTHDHFHINYKISDLTMIKHNINYLLSIYDLPEFSIIENVDDEELPIYQSKQNRKNNEAQLARSRHFKTLSKRPNSDKFKHRCAPKAQKYR